MNLKGVRYNIDMSIFPDFTNVPQYKNLREAQKNKSIIIDDENMEPFIFNNVLSKEELQSFKNAFAEYPKNKWRVQTWGGQGVLDNFSMNMKDINKRVEEMASKAYGEELEVVEVGPSLYSPEFGWEVKLGPHYDTRPIQMFVFDLQISSNEKWDIVVEGKNYNLSDNQAVMFAGTNQVHWREKKEISSNAEVCMVFFWLQHKKQRLFSNSDNEIMKERQTLLRKEVGIDYKPRKISSEAEQYNHFPHQSSVDNSNPLTHNEIYNTILSDEDIKEIYSVIDLSQIKHTTVVDIYAQKVWFVDIPEKIKNLITSKMSHIHNQIVKLEEISFARYSKEYGDLPILTPHYDNTFREPRVTLDIQLRSNMNWPIVVEGKSFTLKDGESLTFSGTHQIHWRENIDLKDGEFVEMLFCHFSLQEKNSITIEDKIKIEQKMVYFTNQFAREIVKENKRLKRAIGSFSHE